MTSLQRESRPKHEHAPHSVKCVVVTGPTATGKTRLGVRLARRFHGEIVSCDSRQVYVGMDIGTGKDLAEYAPPGDRIPVHLIDVVPPSESYHLFRFLSDARNAIRAIEKRRKLPLLVGGTPLYIKALLDDYQLTGGAPDPALRAELEHLSEETLLDILRKEAPQLYARTDHSQRKRLVRAVEIARTAAASAPGQSPGFVLNALLLAPYYSRREVHRRIEARLDARLHQGMIHEVRRLHERGVSWQRLDELGLEYRYLARHLRGELNSTECRNQLLARIRRFCKSQDIWFRKMEREGKIIHWIPGGDLEKAAKLVERFLTGEPLPPPPFQLKDVLYGPKSQ